MTDNTYGLSAETLERAARRSHTYTMGGRDAWDGLTPGQQQIWIRDIRKALPVLAPAIRESLVREMIADIKGTVVVYGESKVELDHVEEWLAGYLPTVEEATS